jgi:HEAT repeat protein
MVRDELLGLAGDVDHLLAAGATAAAGSERLRQRQEALHPLVPQIAALRSVLDALDRVLRPSLEQPQAFLDLLGLARQLRGSLVSVGVAGDLNPVPASGPWQTSLLLRELYPLAEACRGTDPGALGRLRDGRDRGALPDLRLLGPLVGALACACAPVAEFVLQQALPDLGAGKVVPEVLARINLQGEAGDVRRLQLVCRLDAPAGADLCRRAIREGSAALRAKALELLPDFDREEAERLGLDLCQDPDTGVRCAALRALRGASSDRALEAVLTAVRDRDDAVGNTALDMLASLPHPQARARLLQMLHAGLAELAGPDAPAGSVRAALVRRINRFVNLVTLRREGGLAEAAWAVVPLLDHRERELQQNAHRALDALAPEVLRDLLGVLRNAPRNDTSYAEVVGVERLRQADREALFDLLVGLARTSRTEPRKRREAILLLPGLWKGHEREFLGLLRSLLREKDTVVEGAAFEAVAELGPRARHLVPDLLHLLRTGRYLEQLPDVLPRLDPDGKQAVPDLIGALRSPRSHVLWQALRGLEAYGPQARAALPEVAGLLEHPDASIRKEAAACRSALGG